MNSIAWLFLLWLWVLFISCTSSISSANIREYMPGTYVRTFFDSLDADSFNEGVDTIQIKSLKEGTGYSYQVTYRTFYKQTLDGKGMSGKHLVHRYVAEWIEKQGILYIRKRDISLSIDPETRELRNGDLIYTKLK